jgi:hypothetical protein
VQLSAANLTHAPPVPPPPRVGPPARMCMTRRT